MTTTTTSWRVRQIRLEHTPATPTLCTGAESPILTVVYRQFCTDNSVQTIIYRQSYTDSPIQTVLYRQFCTDSSVQTVLYRQSCTGLYYSHQPNHKPQLDLLFNLVSLYICLRGAEVVQLLPNTIMLTRAGMIPPSPIPSFALPI